MIVQLYLKVIDIDKARDFYINELGIFKFITETTSKGDFLMRSITNKEFDIHVEIGNPYQSDLLFGIEVESCLNELNRLKQVNFKSGGLIYKKEKESEPSVFEFPLGKSLMLIDPSGNKSILYEDFYYGSRSDYSESS
jgi:hypothetical protein